MMEEKARNLVNPVAVGACSVEIQGVAVPVLDISFIRLVVLEPKEVELVIPETAFSMQFHLDRVHFSADMQLAGRGEGWMRFSFTRIVPSARAHLRSFLSPKRVGESIKEDWRDDLVRHFHGLNESELWFDQNGAILFSYLDHQDLESQFVVRVPESGAPLKVGTIKRQQYIEMASPSVEPVLTMLSDRDAYSRLGECRDVVTNVRPSGQIEYNLKQRLLKVISEHLYSTGRKVEYAGPRTIHRPSPNPSEN